MHDPIKHTAYDHDNEQTPRKLVITPDHQGMVIDIPDLNKSVVIDIANNRFGIFIANEYGEVTDGPVYMEEFETLWSN